MFSAHRLRPRSIPVYLAAVWVLHDWVSTTPCMNDTWRFFWDCIFVVDTDLPRFEALAYVLPHFDALPHVVILKSSAFICQRFAEVWYSVFVKHSSFKKFAESSKAFIFQKFAVKFYFGLSLHSFSAWFVTLYGKCLRRLVRASNRV